MPPQTPQVNASAGIANLLGGDPSVGQKALQAPGGINPTAPAPIAKPTNVPNTPTPPASASIPPVSSTPTTSGSIYNQGKQPGDPGYVFSDQEIADFAHHMEAKGAPNSDIELFIKSAKGEQLTSNNNAGIANLLGGSPSTSKQALEAPAGVNPQAPGVDTEGMAIPKAASTIPNAPSPFPSATGALDISGGEQQVGDAIGNFAKKEAPQLQEAMDKQKDTGPLDVVKNVGGQFLGGVGDVLGGVGNEFLNTFKSGINAAGAVKDIATGNFNKNLQAPVSPEEQKKLDETSPVRPLNDIIGGTGKVLSSPLAASPVLQKGVSLPFEALNDTIGGILKKTTGIDPESAHGQDIISSLTNALTIGAIGPKNIAEGATNTLEAAKKGVEGIKNVASEMKNPSNQNVNDVVGQIIRGKVKDIPAAVRALGNVDTTNVKTFADLSTSLEDKIKEVKQAQDQHLDTIGEARPLKDYTTKIEVGNKSANVNYVDTALKQLVEVYDKTTDQKNSFRVQNLMEKAKDEGLTPKEVNDVAREYNTTFGQKAFGKTGEPLTSVNAQSYENIRKGIKDTVRNLDPTDKSKILDSQMSDMIGTKKLIDQAHEKVNALQQRVKTPSVGGKIGGTVANVADLASGGVLKGFIAKLIPRNMELKTVNFLDLQEALPKLLDRAQKLQDNFDTAKTVGDKTTATKAIHNFLKEPSTTIGASAASNEKQK